MDYGMNSEMNFLNSQMNNLTMQETVNDIDGLASGDRQSSVVEMVDK